METELPLALANGQLFCVYQPQIELSTGRIHAFETLVRWQHPKHGVVTPNRIIPAVEATGSEAQLFATVIDEALTAQSRWKQDWGFRPSVTVNLAAAQLAGTEVVDTVLGVLAAHTAPASSLWLEVMESALASDDILATLEALHGIGLNLAVDDFGSGGAPLSRVLRGPWDLLKLDRSFMTSLGHDDGAERALNAVLTVADTMGVRTLAEGVETADQLDRVASLGCDLAQGFFLGRPVGVEAASELVDSDGRWTGSSALRTPHFTELADRSPVV